MSLLKFDLPPGLYKNGTEYSSMGRYFESDLVQWFEGSIRPEAGWRLKSDDAVDGRARAILTWIDNDNQTWIAIGTNAGLYVMDRAGTLSDITPVGFVPGDEDATTGGGYGGGLYGVGLYGAPTADDTNVIPAAAWTLDTYGENLIGAFGGVIYRWAPDVGTPAEEIPNSPTAEAVMATDERIIMAIGADGDPRRVAWSGAEDDEDWTPSSTNLAGSKRLTTDGKLLAACKINGGYLIFSDTDVHRVTYVGLPLVYSFKRLGTGCGAIAKGSIVTMGDLVIWMSQNGFWIYNGTIAPLPSEIGDFLFRNINAGQGSKVSGWHNSAFGEVRFCYPSAASTECDRVVIFNYREQHWNDWPMDRLCGRDRGALPFPLQASAEGLVYEHGVGQDRDGREPFALSGPIEIGEGDRTMEVDGIIPDETVLGDVEVSFTTGDWTMDPDEVFGPYQLTAKTDVRFNARRVAVRFTADADQDFRVGKFRFDARPGSPR